MPVLSSYTGMGTTVMLQATGAGSVLSLPTLTAINEDTTNGNSWTQVQALAGGSVQMPLLNRVGNGPVLLESDGAGSQLNVSALPSFLGIPNDGHGSTLQITNGGTVLDLDLAQINGVSIVGDASGVFTLTDSLGLSIGSSTSTVHTGTLVDEGNLNVQSSGTLNVEGGLSVNDSGILTSASGGTIEISGNLLGTTHNADDFNPGGTVQLDSASGSSNPPQLIEAMSANLGAVQTGFVDNFAYGTISLTGNTSAELVDQSHNSGSPSAEAVYADELIVASGATLNLNNLHLYVRGDQISGTVLGGTVTVVPAGGSIALATPTPAALSPAGAIDDWTFFGTAGEMISVQLNPGSGGSIRLSRRCSVGAKYRCSTRVAVPWRPRAAQARARSRRSAASICPPAALTRSRSRRPAPRVPAPETMSCRSIT